MEFSSQVYTCPIIIIFILTWVWRILNRKQKLPPGDVSVHTQSLTPISQHTHAGAEWCGSLYHIASSPCIYGVQSFRLSGLCGKTLSDLPAVVLSIHFRIPTQEDKIPNSIHYDGGDLVPENLIVACYQSRHTTERDNGRWAHTHEMGEGVQWKVGRGRRKLQEGNS